MLTDSNRMLKQRKQPQSGTSNYCQLHPADVLLHRPEALSASWARRMRFSCRCQSPLSVEFTIYSLAFNWTARLVELGVECTSHVFLSTRARPGFTPQSVRASLVN